MREQLIVMTLIKMSISYKYRCGKIGIGKLSRYITLSPHSTRNFMIIYLLRHVVEENIGSHSPS